MPAEFDNLVKTIKEALRRSHPDWSEKKVSDAAYGTATNVWKRKYGSNP